VSSNFSWTNDDALKSYCSYAGTCVTTIIYCAGIVQKNVGKIQIVLLAICSSTAVCRKTKILSLFASWSGCRETYVCYLIIALLKLYNLVENSVYWRCTFFCGVASLCDWSSIFILWDETIMFFRNFEDQTPIYAALYPRRREIWTAPLQKPKTFVC